jgi:hypothetical protein
MKYLTLLLIILFHSATFSQLDEIKVWDYEEPLFGKIIIIKAHTTQFKQDSTGFLFEFENSQVNYIKGRKSDTLWITKKNKYSSDNEISAYSEVELKNDIKSLGSKKRITLFFGYTFSGEHKASIGTVAGSLDINPAMNIGVELDAYKTSNEMFKLGLGVIYQFPRQQKKVKGSFGFIPLFAFFKLALINTNNIRLYFIPALGYNFFTGDEDYSGNLTTKGELYNSVGAGFLINNRFDLKLQYHVNRGSATIEQLNDKIKVNYNSFSLNMGIYF